MTRLLVIALQFYPESLTKIYDDQNVKMEELQAAFDSMNDFRLQEIAVLQARVKELEELALQRIVEFGEMQTALENNAKLRATVGDYQTRLAVQAEKLEAAENMAKAIEYSLRENLPLGNMYEADDKMKEALAEYERLMEGK